MKVTFEDLKKLCSNLIPKDMLQNIDPDQPMTVQGLDSLALTAMAVAVQKNYHITISPEDALKLKTANDVVAYLNNGGKIV